MPDYHTYSNDELRRAVAERLGWYLIDTDATGQLLRGVRPDGQETAVPRWPESLDACWRDLRDSSCTLRLHEDRPMQSGDPCVEFWNLNLEAWAEAETPARAWTIAWLRLAAQTTS